VERLAEIARRARANKFRRDREQLASVLAQLLGHRLVADVLDDASQADSLAAEARAGRVAAEEYPWALVRREWPGDDRGAVTTLVHAISRRLGPRPVWLVVPQQGPPPQVAVLSSDAVLDNPLGFATLAQFELILLDREMPAGLWLGRHSHHYGPGWKTIEYTWELEVWGTEPWLSAATRALRETGEDDAPAG
jgi:hypothetical protein